MVKKDVTIIADYTVQTPITFEEACAICGVPEEVLKEFIRHEVIVPQNVEADQWVFDVLQFKRLQKALRLQRDFEVNVHGIVLVLELLDQLDDLHSQVAMFKKHYRL